MEWSSSIEIFNFQILNRQSNLLQEGDELAGAPLVWLGQVDPLEVDDESLAVPRPVHTPWSHGAGETAVSTGGRSNMYVLLVYPIL